MYWRKMDPEIPPELEDGSDENLKTGAIDDKEKESDVRNLEQRYYRYGVKPEWLQPHRILNHSTVSNKSHDYLIKWRELTYDQASWERDDEEIAGLEDAICAYWRHRHAMTGDTIPKYVAKKFGARLDPPVLFISESEELSREAKKKKRDSASAGPNMANLRKKLDTTPVYVAEGNTGKLHEYQLEGLNWMRHNWSQHIDSILADEMGLGKTIQTIAFLYSLYKEGYATGPFLVSVPLSTVINWEREFEFWAPDFYVVTYVGHKEARAVTREHEFSFQEGAVRAGPKASKLRADTTKFHVLLTSYELVAVDKAILSSINWNVLVVDEAHRLKNNQSLVSGC